jgi:prepilin-type N-terminal cleavage/methylation domain-containing protein
LSRRNLGAKAGLRTGSGFTLIELMVASALALLASTALAFFSWYTSRSFVAATNYTDLALASRMALDNMSRTIRGAALVTAFTTNSISLQDPSNNITQFLYKPGQRALFSITGTNTTTVLTNCDSLQFLVYQRTPISNTFDCYTPAKLYNAKLIQVTWSCSRTILGAKVNTEMMESAKICLRNNYQP